MQPHVGLKIDLHTLKFKKSKQEVSPGRGNRIDFAGGPGAGGNGNRRDQVGRGGESMGRDNWSRWAFRRQCGNLGR